VSVRTSTDVCDWEEWRRPHRCRVRRVEYRRADTGYPVVVLVPTLWGRVVQLLRGLRT